MQNSNLSKASCSQKKVLLRLDLNAPLAPNGAIVDDQRLKSALPTLKILQAQGCQIIILTHLGKPNPLAPDPALSTRVLLPWFSQHGFSACFANTPEKARQLLAAGNPRILLENVRFFRGEQDPAESSSFAATLASLADCYVSDAFGTIHRNDTSVAKIPLLFNPENRFYGLCIEQEVAILEQLRSTPQKPFLALLGGNKLETKVPLIEQFLQAPATARISHLLLGGKLGLAFEQTTLAKVAKNYGVQVVLPIDYQRAADGNCIDIGPKTIATFLPLIQQAKTIFANGTMGKYEEASGQEGTFTLLKAIAENSGLTVIGGGDCAAAATACGASEKVSFVSTGGGATLAYLASKKPWQELPGLKIFFYAAVR